VTDPVCFERRGATAWITLDRPDKGNAIDLPTARALMLATIECDDDRAVRCVVLTGAGRLFCGGGDVAAFDAAGGGVARLIAEITANINAAVARLARMDKPLVTAINGPAAGAGFGLAILGDIALAARSAHFTLGYPAIGLSPDGGATWLLPRLVGLRRAQEMALTNRRIGAEEAASIGLITRLVDDGALAAEADALAQKLARSATRALGAMRALLLASYSATLETQLEQEARSIGELSRTPHGREGVRSFLEKRGADFAN